MNKRTPELILGLTMLAIATGYLILTLGIPRKDTIDATFVPFVLSALLFLLGIIQTIGGAVRKENSPSSPEQSSGKRDSVDKSTVLKTLFLIVAYLALISVFGFIIMTALYLFVQFIVLSPLNRKINYPVYGIVAVVSAVGIFMIFRYVFSLMLPTGLFF